jgi:hypothetical protein
LHKKFLSIILAICMVAGILPTLSIATSAADSGHVAPNCINNTFNAGNGVIDKSYSLSDMDNINAADLSVAQPTPSNVTPGADKEAKMVGPSDPHILMDEETALTKPPTAIMLIEPEEFCSEVADDLEDNLLNLNNTDADDATPVLLTPNSLSDTELRTSSEPTVWDGKMPTANTNYAFSGGNGSETNPYLISTAIDLAQLSANVAGGITYSSTYFEMTANIMLNENVLSSNGTLNSGTFKEWSAIGTSTHKFEGSFDGGNYTISGVYINPTETGASIKYQGLFGYAQSATISNIIIADSYIQGSDRIGGVVGCLSSGKLSNCHNNGSVTGSNNVGGIAGYGLNAIILNCDNSGVISGNGKYVGGIIGYNHATKKPPGTIANCRNSGNVSNGKNYVGGIIGYSTTDITITNCFNSGNVSGQNYIGGVVGHLTSGCLEYCYNTGSISGESTGNDGDSTGGLVGCNYGTVKYCYNIGKVSGKTNAGGVAGQSLNGTVINCFYDKQMCTVGGIADTDCERQAEGKLTLEMVGQNLSGSLGTASNWVFSDNLYPRLAGIDGTDAAYISATPVFLNNNETVTAVCTDFTVGTDNGVIWFSNNPDVINISSGDATIARQKNDTNVILTVSKNDLSRTIEVTISALAAEDPVDKIRLQLANIEIASKTYDKSVEADYMVSGTIGLRLKPGEIDAGHMTDVSLLGTPVITFSDANAGQNKNVNVTGVSLTGARAGLYELDFSNLTGTIRPKPVRLTWTDHSDFVYNNTEKSISAVVTNALPGDTTQVSSYTGIISATDAGTYTAAAATLSDSNYTLTEGSGINNEWTIAAATPTIVLTDKSVIKTGRPITIDAAIVTGVAGGTTPDGTVTYTYYTDSACTTLTYAGTKNAGTAPVDVGTYYVKANIAASGNYETNSSQAATLTIKKVGNTRTKHAVEELFFPDESNWVCPFADINENDWFYTAVEYVNSNGLMNGTNETTFEPNLKTTRAMITAILWRMEGQPEAKAASSFTDVEDETWYSAAIHWAAENKIVKGYDASSFDPSGNITHEQLATILYRYAQYKGYNVSVSENANLLLYHDAFDISEYAIPAIQWAYGAGLINGRTKNALVPQDSATRAETAVLLQRFSDSVVGEPTIS